MRRQVETGETSSNINKLDFYRGIKRANCEMEKLGACVGVSRTGPESGARAGWRTDGAIGAPGPAGRQAATLRQRCWGRARSEAQNPVSQSQCESGLGASERVRAAESS